MLPQSDVSEIRRLCETLVPDHVRDQVTIELEEGPRTATIVECRPPWRDDEAPEWTRSPVARLSFTSSTGMWRLYYHRHTGRWERYPLLGPTKRIGDLLDEITRDPTCIFWG